MNRLVSTAEQSELRAHWMIVLGCFIGVTFGIASVFGYTAGIFIKPLQAEFGWTRSEISAGLLFSTLTTAITSPLMGYITDRVNLRKIIIFSTMGLTVSFVLFANMGNALWLFMLLMAGKSFLSAGTSPVVYTRMVNQWFDRSRGLALGLVLAGTGLAGALFPRLLAPYVAEHGWRAGYLAIAAAVAITAPVIWFLVRDRRIVNQQYEPRAFTSSESDGPSTREAIRSRTFWLMVATLVLPAFGIGGIGIHIIPMMSDAGMTPAEAGTIAGILGGSVIIGRVVTGALIDRLFAPYVAAIIFCVTGFGCLGLAVFGIEFALVAVVLVGLATGAEVDIIGYLIARYFGLRIYGVLYGLMYTAFMLGASISQMIASMVFDLTGNYTGYLYLASIALVIGAGAALRLPRFDSAKAVPGQPAVAACADA